jgi:hypothetical protein
MLTSDLPGGELTGRLPFVDRRVMASLLMTMASHLPPHAETRVVYRHGRAPP